MLHWGRLGDCEDALPAGDSEHEADEAEDEHHDPDEEIAFKSDLKAMKQASKSISRENLEVALEEAAQSLPYGKLDAAACLAEALVLWDKLPECAPKAPPKDPWASNVADLLQSWAEALGLFARACMCSALCD